MEPCLGFEMNVMGMFVVCQRDDDIPPIWTAYSNAQSKATTNNAKPNRIARDRQPGVSFVICFFSNFHIGATEDGKALGWRQGTRQ